MNPQAKRQNRYINKTTKTKEAKDWKYITILKVLVLKTGNLTALNLCNTSWMMIHSNYKITLLLKISCFDVPIIQSIQEAMKNTLTWYWFFFTENDSRLFQMINPMMCSENHSNTKRMSKWFTLQCTIGTNWQPSKRWRCLIRLWSTKNCDSASKKSLMI